MTPEHNIQNAILRAYGSDPRLRLWRANAGVASFHGRTVRFGVPGQADLTGIISHTGQRLEIEVKTETGKQSPDQRNYQAMIVRMGGLYILARSVQDVTDALEPCLRQ
ncbi:MAG: VRR-NUC domain-containing protein [Bryobacteraceae bacterium]